MARCGAWCRRRKYWFFKVLLRDFNKNLQIPHAFLKHIKKAAAGLAILRGPSGNLWHVEVNITNDSVAFQEGWPQFVTDHSLQLGEFLVFKHDGDLQFSVSIYDRYACQKENAYFAKPSEGVNSSIKKWKMAMENEHTLCLEYPKIGNHKSIVKDKHEMQIVFAQKKYLKNDRASVDQRFSEQQSFRNDRLCVDQSFAKEKSLKNDRVAVDQRVARPSLDICSDFMTRNGSKQIIAKEDHIVISIKEEDNAYSPKSTAGPSASATLKLSVSDKNEKPRRHRRKPSLQSGSDLRAGIEGQKSIREQPYILHAFKEEKNFNFPRSTPAPLAIAYDDQYSKTRIEDMQLREVPFSVDLTEKEKEFSHPRSTVLPITPAALYIAYHDQRQHFMPNQIVTDGRESVFLVKRRHIHEEEKRFAIEAAKSFKSDNPFFTVVEPFYTYPSKVELDIPKEFRVKHLSTSRNMTLWDPKQKDWPVFYENWDTLGGLTSGWSEFALGNTLKGGDVCVFELVNDREFSIHIYPVVKDLIFVGK